MWGTSFLSWCGWSVGRHLYEGRLAFVIPKLYAWQSMHPPCSFCFCRTWGCTPLQLFLVCPSSFQVLHFIKLGSVSTWLRIPYSIWMIFLISKRFLLPSMTAIAVPRLFSFLYSTTVTTPGFIPVAAVMSSAISFGGYSFGTPYFYI